MHVLAIATACLAACTSVTAIVIPTFEEQRRVHKPSEGMGINCHAVDISGDGMVAHTCPQGYRMQYMSDAKLCLCYPQQEATMAKLDTRDEQLAGESETTTRFFKKCPPGTIANEACHHTHHPSQGMHGKIPGCKCRRLKDLKMGKEGEDRVVDN